MPQVLWVVRHPGVYGIILQDTGGDNFRGAWGAFRPPYSVSIVRLVPQERPFLPPPPHFSGFILDYPAGPAHIH
jgi:hypothetical protein